MLIGITGGVASGKSTALELIRKMGYTCVDVDKMSHNILEEECIKEDIKNRISKDVFVNGKVDRAKLSKIIFKDDEKFKILNEIMHPLIIEKMKEKIKELKKDKALSFMEVPLLFELHLEKYFDKTLLIYIDKESQIQRLVKRNSISKEDGEQIIARQMDTKEKLRLADIVVKNDKTVFELEEELRGIINENK